MWFNTKSSYFFLKRLTASHGSLFEGSVLALEMPVQLLPPRLRRQLFGPWVVSRRRKALLENTAPTERCVPSS